MGVVVMSLGTSQSAGENVGWTWEQLGAPTTSQGAPKTSLGVPTTSLAAPTTSLGAPRITVQQSGKNNFFENTAGGPGNYSYYLSFNDF